MIDFMIKTTQIRGWRKTPIKIHLERCCMADLRLRAWLSHSMPPFSETRFLGQTIPFSAASKVEFLLAVLQGLLSFSAIWGPCIFHQTRCCNPHPFSSSEQVENLLKLQNEFCLNFKISR